MAFLQILTDPTTTSFNTITILASVVLLLDKRLAPSGFRLPKFVFVVLVACAGIAVLNYAGLMVLSQRVGYADHLQVSVASVAWMAVHGHPAYPSLDGGDMYAMIYGPLLFWLNGLAMRIAPSIAVVTILSAAALAAGMALTWSVLRRSLPGGMAALLLTALMVGQLTPHQFDGFWNRGEPFLYLIAALSLVAASRANPVRAILAIGFLAGAAADIKLTALFCVAPAGLMIIGRAPTWARRAALLAYAALAGLVVLGLPLLIDTSVVRLYRDYLALASGHGLSPLLIRENFSFAVAMLMPVLLPLMWRRPTLARDDQWMLAGLILSLAAEAVLGSKVMSGPYHLIPLLPWTAYAAARAMTAPSAIDGRAGSALGQLAIVTGVLFVADLAVTVHADGVLGTALKDAGAVDDQRTELNALLDRHPDAEVGPAGIMTYNETFIRPLQVMRNAQLHIDPGAWMDLAEGKVDEAKAHRFIENCAVPAWIVPNGEEPFSMYSYYTERPLFSDEFKAAFIRNYAPTDKGQSFSVWTCR